MSLELLLKDKNKLKEISSVEYEDKYKEYYKKYSFSKYKYLFNEEEYFNILFLEMENNNFIDSIEELSSPYVVSMILMSKYCPDNFLDKYLSYVTKDVINILVCKYNYIPKILFKYDLLEEVIFDKICLLRFDKLDFEYIEFLYSIPTYCNLMIKKEEVFSIINCSDIEEIVNLIKKNYTNRLLLFKLIEIKVKKILGSLDANNRNTVLTLYLILLIQERKNIEVTIKEFIICYRGYLDLDFYDWMIAKYNYLPLDILSDKKEDFDKILKLDFSKLSDVFIHEIYIKYKDKYYDMLLNKYFPYKLYDSKIGINESFANLNFDEILYMLKHDNIQDKFDLLFTKSKNNNEFISATKHAFFRNTNYMELYDYYPYDLQHKQYEEYFKFICNYKYIVMYNSLLDKEEIKKLKRFLTIVKNSKRINNYYDVYSMVGYIIKKYKNINFSFKNILLLVKYLKQRIDILDIKSNDDLLNYDNRLNKYLDVRINKNNSLIDIKNSILIKYFRITIADAFSILNKYPHSKVINYITLICNTFSIDELLEINEKLKKEKKLYGNEINIDEYLKLYYNAKYVKKINSLKCPSRNGIYDISDDDFYLLTHVSLDYENNYFYMNEQYRGICNSLINRYDISIFRSFRNNTSAIWGFSNISKEDLLMMRPTDLYSNVSLNIDYFYNEKNCQYYDIDDFIYNSYLIHNEIIINSRNKRKLVKPSYVISIDKISKEDERVSKLFTIPILFIDSAKVLNKDINVINNEIHKLSKKIDKKKIIDLINRILIIGKHFNDENKRGIINQDTLFDLINKCIDIMEEKGFMIDYSFFEDNELLWLIFSDYRRTQILTRIMEIKNKIGRY